MLTKQNTPNNPLKGIFHLIPVKKVASLAFPFWRTKLDMGAETENSNTLTLAKSFTLSVGVKMRHFTHKKCWLFLFVQTRQFCDIHLLWKWFAGKNAPQQYPRTFVMSCHLTWSKKYRPRSLVSFLLSLPFLSLQMNLWEPDLRFFTGKKPNLTISVVVLHGMLAAFLL